MLPIFITIAITAAFLLRHDGAGTDAGGAAEGGRSDGRAEEAGAEGDNGLGQGRARAPTAAGTGGMPKPGRDGRPAFPARASNAGQQSRHAGKCRGGAARANSFRRC